MHSVVVLSPTVSQSERSAQPQPVSSEPTPSPVPWQTYLEEQYEPANRLWMMQYGQTGMLDVIGSVVKNVVLADSDDGGVTWTNVRAATTGLGEMHGSAVELPDGRIVLMHIHRVPWLHGGVRARVSSDGGNTWDPETYYLSTVETYPEYSTDCVLPPELADELRDLGLF